MIQKKVVKVFFSILIISVMILGLCQNTLYATDVTKKVEITKYSYISNGEGGYESAKRGYALKEKDLV